jgi:2'-5' RNA ligase
MQFKLLVFTTIAVVFSGSAYPSHNQSFELSEAIFDAAPFIKNDASHYFGTYLVRNVPFEPIYTLKSALEGSFNTQLFDRSEAHITVITPPEYEQIKDKIHIDEIHAIVQDTLQGTSFELICLGKGSAEIDDSLEDTFFIVVRSNELLEVRRQIAERFLIRGGNSSSFDPETYYPHITVGYTKRDLHAQDGVVKDRTSCVADVHVVGQQLRLQAY